MFTWGLEKKKTPSTSPYPKGKRKTCRFFFFFNGNDPSAGSPTETLLRLLLPLNDQV